MPRLNHRVPFGQLMDPLAGQRAAFNELAAIALPPDHLDESQAVVMPNPYARLTEACVGNTALPPTFIKYDAGGNQ